MDNNNNNSKANNEENPSSSSSSSLEENVNPNPNPNPNNTRTPFTNLSQIDADLALARTLQDQERAYMLLRMNGNGGGDVSDDESWETGSYNDDEFDHHHHNTDEYEDDDEEEEEDAFDVHAHLDDVGSGQPDAQDGNNSNQLELDPSSFPDDEAYARALQDAEDQEMAARLMALTGIHEMATEEEEEDDDDDDDIDEQGVHSQDTWDDVDPDELSYEELIALGEVVGTESRGLSADSIASLRSIIYKTQNGQNGSNETCVICRLDYEDADNLILLSCKHSYHSECITNWLQINKVCPVCSTEVSTSGTTS